MIANIIEQLNNGDINGLEAWVSLRKIEAELKEALKYTYSDAINEAQKHEEKTFSLNGCQIEKKRAGGKWNFSKYPEWQDAKDVVSDIETQAKRAWHSAQSNNMTLGKDGEVLEGAVYIEGADIISLKILKDEQND